MELKQILMVLLMGVPYTLESTEIFSRRKGIINLDKHTFYTQKNKDSPMTSNLAKLSSILIPAGMVGVDMYEKKTNLNSNIQQNVRVKRSEDHT